MLSVQDMHVYYGAIHAVKGVSLEVGEGEIVALLGANGAGKTTTLKAIAGVIRPRKGRIMFRDREVGDCGSHVIVGSGICLVPEGRHVFPRMSVYENLLMGAYTRSNPAEITEGLDRVVKLFPFLRQRYGQMAGTLSGGEQQMLAIARGLMARPKLLMLDEPSLGLAPFLVDQLFELIKQINQQDGTTILLVEQNARMALAICHRGYVMETGGVVLHGTSQELRGNDQVRQAYLR